MSFGARDVIAIVAGLALYVVFALWLHPLLIGVPVITAAETTRAKARPAPHRCEPTSSRNQ